MDRRPPTRHSLNQQKRLRAKEALILSKRTRPCKNCSRKKGKNQKQQVDFFARAAYTLNEGLVGLGERY